MVAKALVSVQKEVVRKHGFEGEAGYAQVQVCLMEHAADAVVTASIAAATTQIYARAGINLQEALCVVAAARPQSFTGTAPARRVANLHMHHICARRVLLRCGSSRSHEPRDDAGSGCGVWALAGAKLPEVAERRRPGAAEVTAGRGPHGRAAHRRVRVDGHASSVRKALRSLRAACTGQAIACPT